MNKQLGHRPTFEEFLLAEGDEQLAKAWRYRESAQVGYGLLGDGDHAPRKRDIRDFIGEVQRAPGGKSLVHYSKHEGKRISFTDQGKRIDIWETSDGTAVLAALQLGFQKWGDITVTGSMEFKLLCAEVASKNGIKIVNPELQHVNLPRCREHAPQTTPPGSLTTATKPIFRAACSL